MVTSAWEIDKVRKIARVKGLFSDEIKLAKIANKNIDIPQRVIKVTQQMKNNEVRAKILSGMAHILNDKGYPENTNDLSTEALRVAGLANKEAFLETLANAASSLALKDNGMLLWRIYNRIDQIENNFPIDRINK